MGEISKLKFQNSRKSKPFRGFCDAEHHGFAEVGSKDLEANREIV
jgi:hypothetical protein